MLSMWNMEKFQFYLSSIKSVNLPANVFFSSSFNSTLVQLKAVKYCLEYT